MKNPGKGAFMAVAVAGLFMAGMACSKKTGESSTSGDAGMTNTNAATAEKVECHGVNECKGTGECGSATAGTSCAGTNECKGKGWISLAADECKERGGKTM